MIVKDGKGSLLSTMVVLRVDVAYSRYDNPPKVQSDASFLLRINISEDKARQNKKLSK